MHGTGRAGNGRRNRLTGWLMRSRLRVTAERPVEHTRESVLAGLEIEIEEVRYALESVRRDPAKPRGKTRRSLISP